MRYFIDSVDNDTWYVIDGDNYGIVSPACCNKYMAQTEADRLNEGG